MEKGLYENSPLIRCLASHLPSPLHRSICQSHSTRLPGSILCSDVHCNLHLGLPFHFFSHSAHVHADSCACVTARRDISHLHSQHSHPCTRIPTHGMTLNCSPSLRNKYAEQIAWARQNFIVYSWTEDGEPHNLHRFQGRLDSSFLGFCFLEQVM